MNLNRHVMTSTDLRVELHQLIDRVDEGFLEAVHGLVAAYLQKDQVIGYDENGAAVLARDFVEQAKEAIASIQKGESGIGVEELEQRSNQWLTPSK